MAKGPRASSTFNVLCCRRDISVGLGMELVLKNNPPLISYCHPPAEVSRRDRGGNCFGLLPEQSEAARLAIT
jgi:hypothetical protein